MILKIMWWRGLIKGKVFHSRMKIYRFAWDSPSEALRLSNKDVVSLGGSSQQSPSHSNISREETSRCPGGAEILCVSWNPDDGGAHFSGGGAHFSDGGAHFSDGGAHFSGHSSNTVDAAALFFAWFCFIRLTGGWNALRGGLPQLVWWWQECPADLAPLAV